MGDSVWGRFSAFTGQLSQLTREVIADEDVYDQDERQEPAGESLEEDNEAFFVDEEDYEEGAQQDGEQLARLKSIIATQKRELAGRQKEAQDMKDKWAASQTNLQKLLATKQEEIASLQRENLQLADVRGRPGLKDLDLPTFAGPGNVGAPSPARSPSIDSLHDLAEIEAEKIGELSSLLKQSKEENERLRRRVTELSASEKRARSESGAEEMAAAMQAQHQERLQKIVEAHNRDLTLLQETYQACAARLKETDAVLAEEKRKVADLEREKKNLTQLASAASLRPPPPPPGDSLPPAEGLRESEKVHRAKEENERLKQTVLELQRERELQQDAMAKLKSQDEGTIGMMQTLITEKERLLAEREELMNIFRSLKLDDGRSKSVISLARQVSDRLKASEQQRKHTEGLEAAMRSDEEEKSRLAAQLESATREREQLRADAQHMSTEIQRLQALADAAQRTARDGAETLESAQRRYLSAESQTEAERRDKERMRAEGEGLREDLKVAERQRDGERAERERLQRELEMERRERDMMREDESDRMHRAGEAEEHKLQALEREKAGLERNVRMLEMRRREWAERELKWDAERADLLERQRLAELELGQLRVGRAEREQALASTEELAHKQNEELRKEMGELRAKHEELEQSSARLQQQLDEARRALVQAGANAIDAQRVASLESQVEEAKKKLEKANKDSERLRMHLIDSEDTHNLQLIEQQKKIDELTKRIEDFEGREHQMNDVLARYDQLAEEYREKEMECEETAMALMNLQTVLEQFQSNKEAEARYEIASLHKQIAAEQDKVRRLSHDLDEASRAHKRCEEAERQMQKLHEELSQKSREVVKLREEAEPIRKALEESMRRLHSAAENGKNMVDRRLVAKLLVTYFSRQSNQGEVLGILSSILEFSEEEKIQVGLVKPKRRWLFFGGEDGGQKDASPNKEKTLADLWVEFLLQEASENAEGKSSSTAPQPLGAAAAAAAAPKDWERKLSQINAATNSWPSSLPPQADDAQKKEPLSLTELTEKTTT